MYLPLCQGLHIYLLLSKLKLALSFHLLVAVEVLLLILKSLGLKSLVFAMLLLQFQPPPLQFSKGLFLPLLTTLFVGFLIVVEGSFVIRSLHRSLDFTP